MTNKAVRVLSFLMAMSIFISSASPGGVAFAASENSSASSTQAEATATGPSETTEGQADLLSSGLVIPVKAKNCIIRLTDGTEVTDSIAGESGDIVLFQILPVEGCEITSVLYNNSTVAPANGVYSITLKENASLSIVCSDITAPVISTPVRTETGWVQRSHYTFTVTENVLLGSVYIIDSNDSKVSLTADENGTYTAVLTANGTFTIRAQDTSGLRTSVTIDEEFVDATAPTIVNLSRQEDGWTTGANYTLQVRDSQSGILKVTLQKEDGEEVTQGSLEGDTCPIRLDASATYTIRVYDNVGNVHTQTLTDSQIDTNAPVIDAVTRKQEGWQKTSATYSFTVKDTGSGISSVFFGKENGTLATVTAGSNGIYTVTVDANTQYKIVAIDNTGWETSYTFTEDHLDLVNPEVSVPVRDHSEWSSEPGYSFAVTDIGSGIANVTLARETDGSTTTLTPGVDGTCLFSVTKNGKYTITVTDIVGRTTTVSFSESMCDIDAPTITNMIRIPTGWSTSAVYRLEVSDAASGIAYVSVKPGTGAEQELSLIQKSEDDPYNPKPTDSAATFTPYYTFRIEGNTDIEIIVKDHAGNVLTQQKQELYIDRTAPSISTPQRASSGQVQLSTYTFTVSEEGSGLSSVVLMAPSGETTTLVPDESGTFKATIRQNGTYTITAADILGNTSSISFTEADVDSVAPEIQDVSRTTTGWQTKATYTFKVLEETSGLKAVYLTVNGKRYDLSAADGIYSFNITRNNAFTITAEDAVGNKHEISMNEAKVDPDAPVISQITRAESGWAQSSTYTFTVDDPLSGIAEVTISLSDGTSAVLTPMDGLYSFQLSENLEFTITAIDSVGNTATVRGEESQIDRESPKIMDLKRQDDLWHTEAVFTFRVSETASGIASVTVATGDGTPVVLTPVDGVYRFTATSNGVISITAADTVGNTSTENSIESKIDLAAPKLLDMTRKETGWATSASYSFRIEETDSGLNSVVVVIGDQEQIVLTPDESGIYTFTVSQNAVFTVTATDMVANAAEVSGVEDRIDTTAPEIKNLIRVDASWTKEAVYEFLVDDPASGIKTVLVQINGVPKTLTSQDGRYTFSMVENGKFTVTVIDSLGNTATVNGEEALVDTAAPAIMDFKRTESGWQVSAEYTFLVYDDASEVESVTVCYPDGTVETLTVREDGRYAFDLKQNGSASVVVADLAGNETTQVVDESLVDPECPVITEPQRHSTSWDVKAVYTFSVADTLSGIGRVFSIDADGTETELTPTNGIYAISFTTNGTIQVAAEDYAGNISNCTITEQKIDTTAPSVQELIRDTTGWSKSATYTFRVFENQCGIKKVTLALGSGTPQIMEPENGVYTFTLEANTSFTIRTLDYVGNTETLTIDEQQVDGISPTLSTPVRVETGWSSSATYNFTCTDGLSGIRSVTLTLADGTMSELTGVDGRYYFVLSANADFQLAAVDNVGNTSVVNGSEQFIDNADPIITNLTRLESGYATSATYTFTIEEAESGIQSVTLTVGIGDSVPLTPVDGMYQFTLITNDHFLITVTDNLGHSTTAGGDETKIDRIGPEIGTVQRAGNSWHTEVTYTFTVQDTQAGMMSVKVVTEDQQELALTDHGDSKYSFTATENTAYSIIATDKLGNTSSQTVTESKLDLTAPAVSIADMITEVCSDGNHGWYRSIRYYLDVQEEGSGISTATVTLGSTGSKLTLYKDSANRYYFNLNQNDSFLIQITDQMGNVGTLTGEVLTIDRTAPAIQNLSRNTDQWTNEAHYSFLAVDTDAGICSVKLTIENCETVTLAPNAEGKYSFTMVGNKSFVIVLEDHAGNTYTYTGKETKIDPEAPQITNLKRSESTWSKTATYSFYVSDSHSGVAEVTVTVGNDEPVVLTASGTRYTFTISTNDSFVIIAEDMIGNESRLEGTESLTDNTAPAVQNLTRSTRGWTTSAEYTFTVEETQSGIQSVLVYVNGARRSVTQTDGVYTFTANANGLIRIDVVDRVGNTGSFEAEETGIDADKPVLSALTRVQEGWVKSADYTFTATDEGSGLVSVTLTWENHAVELEPDEDGTYSFTGTSNATYTVTVTDGVGYTYTRSVTESKIDSKLPEILNFQRTRSGWQSSSTYSFRVTDSESGIHSVYVKIGESEPQLLEMGGGRYTFTVTQNVQYEVIVADNVGNIATLVGAESEIDLTAPEITAIGRISDTWEASAGYRFSVEETESGIKSVTVASGDQAAVTVERDSDGYYSFYASANGTYTITVTDNVGNSASAVIEETMVDSTAPEIYNILRNPEKWSQEGSYTFWVKDKQSGILAVHVTQSKDAEMPLTQNEDGSYTFPVTANADYNIIVTDLCGNTTSVVVGENKIDLVPPVIQTVLPQTEWSIDSNIVTMMITDESELDQIIVTDDDTNVYEVLVNENGTFCVALTKNGTYRITAFDKAGNSVAGSFKVTHIDSAAPTKPELTVSADDWTNQNVTISANSTDDQSGISAFYFSYTGNSFAQYPEEWHKMSVQGTEGKIILTENQDNLYYIIAVDAVGRSSDISTVIARIDKIAPEISFGAYQETADSGFIKYLGNTAIYLDQVTFTAKASDDASSISQIAYRLVGDNGYTGDWIVQNTPLGTLDVAINDIPEGKYTIYLKAKDTAGNWTREYQLQKDGVVKDHILEYTVSDSETVPKKPTLTVLAGHVTYNGSWTNKDVTIRVSGSGAASGIAGYEYMITPENPNLETTEWMPVPVDASGKAQIVISQDTNAVYHFRAITNAGNISQEVSTKVLVQKTLPNAAQATASTPTGTNGWYTKTPVITVVAPSLGPYAAPVFYEIAMYRDNVLVVRETTYSLEEIPEIPEDGIWKVVITAKDDAGNVAPSDAGTVSIKLDSTPPTALSVMLNSIDITNIREDITAGWKDGVSTINHVLFSDYQIFENRASRVQAYANGGLSGKATLYYQTVPVNSAYKQLGEWKELPSSGIKLEPEGKYCLFFKAVDGAGNIAYFSGSSVILDSQAPVGRSDDGEITITLSRTNMSTYGCYAGDVSAAITIMEPDTASDNSFSGLAYATYRILTDGEETASGVLFSGDLEDEGIVKAEGDRVKHWTGNITIDAKSNNSNNVVIEVTAHDQAGNVKVTQTVPGAIKIDVDKPIIEASYDHNNPVATFEDTEAFTGTRTLTVTVKERNFEELEAIIKVTNTDNTLNVNYEWIHQDDLHTAVIPIESDGHYEVTMSFTDGAGNISSEVIWSQDTVAATKFIIDNTAPMITASYDNNNVRNGMYFHSARTITIRVVERNFDPSKISSQLRVVLEGGATSTLYLSNWVSNGYIHSLTYKCIEDGTYSFQLSGCDALGNAPQEIRIDGEATSKFIVDTHIDDPIFENVIDGGAYAGTIIPSVTVMDENLDSVLISMTRANRNESREDVSNSMLSELELVDIEGGKTALLDVFESIPEYDGIYTLTVFASDLAGNIVQETLRFSVNRFGSVYVYDQDTTSLISDSRQMITDDLVVSEYNPSAIVAGSSRVFITRDGMPISDPIYEVTPVTTTEEEGVTKWCQYDYVISKDNFTEDGIYEVVISTQDSAGNYPENTAEEYVIRFSVDTTPPQLSSIIGLEDAIYKGTYLDVVITATDNVSVESITIYVNNAVLSEWHELSGYTVEREFGITEGMDQSIRIIVEDAAGNKLDTKEETFQPGYEFNRTVTVSGNFFLRFYANKPLFYSFMILTILLGIVWIILLIREEHRNAAEEEAEIAADIERRQRREEESIRAGKYESEENDGISAEDGLPEGEET